MAKISSVYLEESLEWIRNHPAATNLDVPPRLRANWMYEQGDGPTPPGFHLAVFTFGLCLRRTVRAPGQKLQISAAEIWELFNLWQMKLGLAEVSEKTEIKTKPLPLYDFPKGEQIECWCAPEPSAS